MEKLFIAKTKVSPEIDFDPATGLLKITGESYPEDPAAFYDPVLKWVELFLEEKRETVCEFRVSYFNSSSSRCLLILMDLFDDAFQSGTNVVIKWYYEKDDEMTLECGEDFSEDLQVPFHLIEN